MESGTSRRLSSLGGSMPMVGSGGAATGTVEKPRQRLDTLRDRLDTQVGVFDTLTSRLEQLGERLGIREPKAPSPERGEPTEALPETSLQQLVDVTDRLDCLVPRLERAVNELEEL